MTERSDDTALLRQGADWVERLTSGAASETDAAALVRWRSQSPDHARAFREAVAFRDALIQVGKEGLLVKGGVARKPALSRRLVLGGGLAMASAVAVYAAVNPPMDLWPSLTDMAADYRTQKGQQQNIALARGLSIELNTHTSLEKGMGAQGRSMELLHGEVAVNARLNSGQDFELVAGRASTVSNNAQFNVLRHAGKVCVTCAEGKLIVRSAEVNVVLPANHQLSYDNRTMGSPVAVNAALFTAWRAGLIVLRDVSLGDAIAEINRYRPGVIVIGTDALKKQRLNTVLHMSELDRVVPLICNVTGAHAAEVGSYVLLT